jgi:hypothetical protein
MSKTIRIRTTPNGGDNFIKINMEQDFDFVEVLSLKISQKDLYTTFCADYGAVVGRVIVNNGFGVPNAKVSIFIPVSDLDAENDEIFSLYPYEKITDKGPNGLRYNLLPNSNETNDDCFTPIGDFPKKRAFLDDDRMLEIYCKYYKFSTTTNESGDYMIFGVPVGSYTVYVEADLSDVGIVSQKPYDFIRKGSSVDSFDSTTKFKRASDNIETNAHVVNRIPASVNIQPYWGEKDTCNVVITRQDINLNTVVTPHAIFMGSIFGDSSEFINLRCKPSSKLGKLSSLTTGAGTIDMIRETLDGTIERFDISGGKLIDSDGTWSYQVPMNLDYQVTDEFGDLVPTDDTDRGIPTRARVRFRIGMDNNAIGVTKRAKYLVPHNPRKHQLSTISNEFPYGEPIIDFEFGPNTNKASLADLTWNTVYSVKNYIRRYEKTYSDDPSNRAFIGIKDVDSANGTTNPFPYNSLNIVSDSLFNFICGLVQILAIIVANINFIIIGIINFIISVINGIILVVSFGTAGDVIPYVPCITLECTSGGNSIFYAPGCESGSDGCNAAESEDVVICVGSLPYNDFGDTLPPGDAGYTACVALSLLQSLDLLEFDFFNDWVNGTLYSPPFLNINSEAFSSKDYFCEWSCGGFSGYTANGVSTDGTNPDNGCVPNTVVNQICGEGVFNHPNLNLGCSNTYYCTHPTESPFPNPGESVEGLFASFDSTTDVNQYGGYGVIVKKDDEYYYTPYARISDDYILATDIITLGSSVACHWQGLPSIIGLLDDTSYKLPPYIPSYDKDNLGNEFLSMSGMDSESNNLTDSLFFNVNCFYTSSGPLQCNNIRRQCELGMGLDQQLDSSSPPADNTLDDIDFDIRVVRNLFAWMNNYTLSTQNSMTVDTGYGSYAYDPNGIDEGCGAILGKPDYLTFKYDWKSSAETGILCRNKTKTLNSFYFYFGLNKSKTAVSKTLEKYFSPCAVQTKSPFTIISDSTAVSGTTANGIINVTIIGGTGPYTLTITYPDGTVNEVPIIGSNITFTGLEEGSYPITVTDSNGLTSTTTVIVGGPVPLNCFVEGIPISGFESNNQPLEDGIINIEVSDGIEPYTVTIAPLVLLNPLILGTQVYNASIAGGMLTVSNLAIGPYVVQIQDSNNPPSTCSSLAVILEPTAPQASVLNAVGILCEGSCTGYVQIGLSGDSPYNITLTRIGGGNIPNSQSSNTTPNSNTVTIIGHTNSTLVINSLCFGNYSLGVVDANGQAVTPSVTFTIPNAPYTAAQLELAPNTNILLSGSFSMSAGTITINQPNLSLVNGDYTYNLYDSNNPVGPIQTIISNTSPVAFTGLDCNGGGSYYITYETDNGCRFPTNLNERFAIPINVGFGC